MVVERIVGRRSFFGKKSEDINNEYADMSNDKQ